VNNAMAGRTLSLPVGRDLLRWVGNGVSFEPGRIFEVGVAWQVIGRGQ